MKHDNFELGKKLKSKMNNQHLLNYIDMDVIK